MNPLPELSPYLKQLRLSGILDSLEARNRQAIDGKLAYTEFLALLIMERSATKKLVKIAHSTESPHRTATLNRARTLDAS